MQSLRVVDHIEKRYAHPGLNLSDPVREGILKTCAGAARSAALDPAIEGVRQDLAPIFEVQVVALADRISSSLSDLDDALQSGMAEVERVERLRAVRELRKKLGAAYPARGGRFVKANAIHRGLIHLLVTGAMLAGQRVLKRWASRYSVETAQDFRTVRATAVRGGEIGLPPAARRMLEEIEGFLEGRIHRGFEADRVHGRGRRVLLGLFAAYHADPTLLEDHVLFRYKELAGGRYLRDLPRPGVEREVVARYRKDPVFVRVLVDHLAAMTDTYALTEHARLMQMGGGPDSQRRATQARVLIEDAYR